MNKTRIHQQWPASGGLRPPYRTGVSLHSHTLHSRESLDFITAASRRCAALRALLRHGDARHRRHYGGARLDLRRGWWTPPLAPLDAHRLEAGQVAGLGLTPIVSLTDHDDLEAPMSLQAVVSDLPVPVSVEWTLPWHGTYFHLGIHNLPPARARAIMTELAWFTCRPRASEVRDILGWLHDMPGTLLVLNHPLWDEKGVGRESHTEACQALLRQGQGYLHALEINGLRPLPENDLVLQLAETARLPAISGGDRHGIEPNANLNLTAADTFSAFADEVRCGHSDVLLMPHYRQSHHRRIAQNMVDILQPFQRHRLGWREWQDRVFYESPDGRIRSLREWWGGGTPWPVRLFEQLIWLAGAARVRTAPLVTARPEAS